MSITTRLRRPGWIAMTVMATLVALASARYFTLNPATFIPNQVQTYLANLGPLLLHVGGGVVALAVGPWQLWTGLRTRRPAVHRSLGRVYVAAVLAAAAGGLLLAPLSQGGPVAHLAFATGAVGLLLVTGMGFLSIRRRRIAAHRAWMVRSYALIFAAVTFRLWLGVLTAMGLPFQQVYASGAWAVWFIDLFVAEALLGVGAAAAAGRAAVRSA